MTETQNLPIRKLYITLYSEYETHKAASNHSVNFDTQAKSKIEHVGIVCDGCEKGVYGFRYKCLQCSNYDLCSECESKGIHPEHSMIRISVPLQWKPHYGKRLSHHINKFMKKASSYPVHSEEEPKECLYKNKRYANVQNHCDQTQSWIDTFATYLNDWANLPGECPAAEQDKNKPTTSKLNQESSNKSAMNKKTPEDAHIEFLKNIGENIAQFLDPLGIDVDVQVKGPKTVPEDIKAKDASDSEVDGKDLNGGDKSMQKGSAVQKEPEITSTTTAATTDVMQGNQLVTDAGHSKGDDWTLLDKDGASTSSSTSAEVSPDNAVPSKVGLFLQNFII